MNSEYKMTPDERTRELIRMREKALHDEASLLEEAMEKGREERNKELAEKWHRKGYSEDQIKELLSE